MNRPRYLDLTTARISIISPTYRSLLFVPASQPRLLAKAHLCGADALIIDLEDGVAEDQRSSARANVAAQMGDLKQNNQNVLVRINPLDAGGTDDLSVLDHSIPLQLVLPKVTHPDQVSELIATCITLGSDRQRLALYPMIESPGSLFDARDIARKEPEVKGIIFGSEDFATSGGLQTSHSALSMPAQWVALASAAAGIAAYGLPGSLANYTDLDLFNDTVQLAKTLGFTGALCIHPDQVPLCNQGFLPTEEELAWAKQVLAAEQPTANRSGGARGHALGMIDPPVLARAQRLLDWANQHGVANQ